MKKKLLPIVLCLTMACVPTMTHANENDSAERISEIESEIEALQGQLESLEDELEELISETEIAESDNSAPEIEVQYADDSENAENVICTFYTNNVTQQIMAKFENDNDCTVYIQKINFSFYDESGELIDAKTMGGAFVRAGSVNYSQMLYSEKYASATAVVYAYTDEENFDYTEFETVEYFDDEYPEVRIIITNTGDSYASAMPTIVYYRNDELFYVAEDIGETWLAAGDSEETYADAPHDSDYNLLEYDDYEIIMMGYVI